MHQFIIFIYYYFCYYYFFIFSQPCPTNAIDYRTEQCQALDAKYSLFFFRGGKGESGNGMSFHLFVLRLFVYLALISNKLYMILAVMNAIFATA